MFDDVFPVLFTEAMNHCDVRTGRKPTSAGFFSVRPKVNDSSQMTVSVWGKSISLRDLESKPEDAAIIENFLNS